MFSHYASRKISPICKILTFSEDLSLLNPGSHFIIPENYLWRSQSITKLPDANLQVNINHVFWFYFLKKHDYCFFRRGFESVRGLFLSRNKWKVVACYYYLFDYDSSKSIIYLSNKLEFFVSCNIKITRAPFFFLCVIIYISLYKPNCSSSWW